MCLLWLLRAFESDAGACGSSIEGALTLQRCATLHFALQLMTPSRMRLWDLWPAASSRTIQLGRPGVQALCRECGGEYGLACEHAHSCCILLARRSRFHRDGAWHTWIDYERFQV